jgi:hypothetical protein
VRARDHGDGPTRSTHRASRPVETPRPAEALAATRVAASGGGEKKRETLGRCFPLLAFLEADAVRNHAKGKGYDSLAWRAVQGKALLHPTRIRLGVHSLLCINL